MGHEFKYETYEEAIQHAVPLKTLREGQLFEVYYPLDSAREVATFICLEGGSVLVRTNRPRPARTIRKSSGDEVEIAAGVNHQRVTWSLETPVCPLDEFESKENLKRGATTMATKKAKKAAKKTRKEVREYVITRYTLTGKIESEKGAALLDKEKTTHNALIAQTLHRLRKPSTFEEIQGALDMKAFGSESKNVESIIRWHIQDLRKKGFVKSTEHKEDVKVEVATPAPAAA